jgi:hypothetical protein
MLILAVGDKLLARARRWGFKNRLSLLDRDGGQGRGEEKGRNSVTGQIIIFFVFCCSSVDGLLTLRCAKIFLGNLLMDCCYFC